MAKKVLSIVLVLVSVVFFSQVNADMAFIERVCKKTQDYKLCVSILKSNPRSFNTDAKGLARIMMDVIKGKADVNLGVIHQLGKNESDPGMRECLNSICYSMYDDSTDKIQIAIEYLQSNSLGEAILFVDYVGKDEEECENCFVELPTERKSPITPINSYFAALCKITEDIIYNLIKAEEY